MHEEYEDLGLFSSSSSYFTIHMVVVNVVTYLALVVGKSKWFISSFCEALNLLPYLLLQQSFVGQLPMYLVGVFLKFLSRYLPA